MGERGNSDLRYSFIGLLCVSCRLYDCVCNVCKAILT